MSEDNIESIMDNFYKRIKTNNPERNFEKYQDELRLHFQNIIDDMNEQLYISQHYRARKIRVEIINLSEISKINKHVLVISVDKSNDMVPYMKKGLKQIFEKWYIRGQGRNTELNGSDLIKSMSKKGEQ